MRTVQDGSVNLFGESFSLHSALHISALLSAGRLLPGFNFSACGWTRQTVTGRYATNKTSTVHAGTLNLVPPVIYLPLNSMTNNGHVTRYLES
jgi:hypothetical protein